MKSPNTTEKKEWNFGTLQAKVKIENNQLSWSSTGAGGSSYPLRSVTGVQYEAAGCLSFVAHFVILGPGGDNQRVQIPKKNNSVKLIQEINAYIHEYHDKQQGGTTVVAAPSVAEELTKLAALKTQGILSEEEFQAQKGRLLSGN